MSVPDKIILFDDNTQALTIAGLSQIVSAPGDPLEYATVTDADVIATLYDGDDNPVDGCTSITLSPVGSPHTGNYSGTVNDDFNPDVGDDYCLKVDVSNGPDVMHLEILAEVKARRDGGVGSTRPIDGGAVTSVNGRWGAVVVTVSDILPAPGADGNVLTAQGDAWVSAAAPSGGGGGNATEVDGALADNNNSTGNIGDVATPGPDGGGFIWSPIAQNYKLRRASFSQSDITGGAPVLAIPAPPSGHILAVIQCVLRYRFGTTAYAANPSAQFVFGYGAGMVAPQPVVLPTLGSVIAGLADQTSNRIGYGLPTGIVGAFSGADYANESDADAQALYVFFAGWACGLLDTTGLSGGPGFILPLTSGGSGYTFGDRLDIPGVSGTAHQGVVGSVDGSGAILGFRLITSDPGNAIYDPNAMPISLVPHTTTTGSGATVTLPLTPPGDGGIDVYFLYSDINLHSGGVLTTSIASVGSGYAVGDTGDFFSDQGGFGATYVITSVDESSAVTGYTLTSGGEGYSVTGLLFSENSGSQPGSGSGFLLNILSVGL